MYTLVARNKTDLNKIRVRTKLLFELFFELGFIVVPSYVYYFQRGRVYIWAIFETVNNKYFNYYF